MIKLTSSQRYRNCSTHVKSKIYPTIYIDSGTTKHMVISLDVENAFDNIQHHSKYESGNLV